MSSVSVVIPTCNAACTLGLQLDALAHQVDAPLFEVLIIDNGSHDGLAGLLAHWDQELHVRSVRAVAAQGVAYARNVGLVNARGRDVVFLDADDCAGPGFVAAAVKALESAEFVTGNVVPLEPETFAGGRVDVWGALGDVTPPGPEICAEVEDGYPIYMGGASAVRRQAAIDLGGFDQAFVPGAEDNDFGMRVVSSGRGLRRCEGMVLGERRRATAHQTFWRSFDSGRMHMRLCAVHDLWSVSPHLHHPRWWVDLLKVPMAGLVALRPGADSSTRKGWAGRAGLRLGQGCGFLQFRLLRRIGAPQLRVGFEEISQ